MAETAAIIVACIRSCILLEWLMSGCPGGGGRGEGEEGGEGGVVREEGMIFS